MSLSFRAQTVNLGARAVSVLIIEPNQPLVIGMERLSSAAAATSLSAADKLITAAAREAKAEITVFNATPANGVGRWGIDPSLSDERADSVADHLMSTQLITERTLLANGVGAHVRVGMTTANDHRLRAARLRLRERLESELALVGDASDYRRRSLEVAAWLTQHFAFFFAVDLERFFAETLVSQGPVFARHLDRVQRFKRAQDGVTDHAKQ